MQNSIYKIKYLLFLSWDWEAWCLTVWGVIPPHPHPERNTAWNKGRKCFHCLGAPNNLIRPWSQTDRTSHLNIQGRMQETLRKSLSKLNSRITLAEEFIRVFVKYCKGKGKVHCRTGHEGSEGEWRYSSTLSLTSALDMVGCQRYAPVALSRERPGTHCIGGWVWPGTGLDGCGKSGPPPGFDTRTVQPVASRRTDWHSKKTPLYEGKSIEKLKLHIWK